MMCSQLRELAVSPCISTLLVLLSMKVSADSASLAGSLWRCTRASDQSQFVIEVAPE
jgi:hypothetical protein